MAEFAIRPLADPAFAIDPVPPYTPTRDEAAWCDRFNRLVARLSVPGAEPEHTAARAERNDMLGKLRTWSDAICAAETARRAPMIIKATKDSYWAEGIFTDRLCRIDQLPFDVEPVPGKRRELVVDIEIYTRDMPISDEKQTFKVLLDQAITVVQTVFPDDDAEAAGPVPTGRAARLLNRWRATGRRDNGPVKSEYLKALAGIARVGLMGQDKSQTPFATLALTGFANEFVSREAGRVKNRYVRKLGAHAMLAVVASFLCYVVADLLVPTSWTMFRFKNFFVLAGGAAVGTWLSFSIRRQVLTFPDLATLEEDRLNPGVRIWFMIALTTVVGLMFWTQMVVLTIGQFHTDFRLTGAHAALIGALCGIAERSLTGAVGKRASEFVGGIGGAAKAGS